MPIHVHEELIISENEMSCIGRASMSFSLICQHGLPIGHEVDALPLRCNQSRHESKLIHVHCTYQLMCCRP